jgi:hypothetical protein
MRGTGWIKRVVFVTGILIGLATAAPAGAGPIVIRFEAVDLADVVPGEDRWQYEYVVSDYMFEVDQGFSIYFDPALYANLQDPLEVNADWDVIAVQPDPALPADGFFDALALSPGASLSDPFAIAFVWLGSPGTTPGPQPLTVNQFSASGELSILETGRTTRNGVPAPPALPLLAIGGAALALRHRRQRSLQEAARPVRR